MLPYVLDIKSLHLDIRSATSNFGGMYEMLHGILELTELEELSLQVTFAGPYNNDSGDVFFNKLRECCTKLRALKIRNNDIIFIYNV